MAKRKRRAKGTGSIRRLRITKDTELEADRWLTQQKYEHERNMLPTHGAERITVAEYLEFGKIKRKDLTTSRLQALNRRKSEEGLSRR